MWTSSPYLWKAFPEIHLLTTLSILFSGGTFVQFKKWAKHLHLNFMTNKTFFEIQKAYLNPENTQMNTTMLEKQQREGSYVQIPDDGHCVAGGFILTRTQKGPLKKIKFNLQRREKAAPCLQSRCKLESDLVNVSGPTALRAAGADDICPEDIYVPIIPQRSTTSELLLECEDEDLEPWQEQTSQTDLKDEADAGESTNEETDCKSEPSSPPRYATNT